MVTKTKEAQETTARLRAEQRDAKNWATCSSCSMERRIVNGLILKHNRYAQGPGQMIWCEGSDLPPAEQAEAAPATVFTASAPVGAEQR